MADEEQVVNILAKVPLFKGLGKRQLEKLSRIMVDRSCDEDEVIVPQGQTGYGFFIIASGAAKAVRERSDGSEVVVNTFGPGDFFGELSMLDDGPRTATVVATEPTRCLVLPRWNFLGVLRQDGEMTVSIMIELAKRFRTALDTV
jgi:CRP-like cAMP-binding protein